MLHELVGLRHIEHVALPDLPAADGETVTRSRIVPPHIGPNCRLHDERKDGHALSDVLRREASLQTVGDELFDVEVVDVGHLAAREVGADVALEHAEIPAPGGGTQPDGGGPPAVRPGVKLLAPGLGVDPLPTPHIRRGVVKEVLGVLLAVERLRPRAGHFPWLSARLGPGFCVLLVSCTAGSRTAQHREQGQRP